MIKLIIATALAAIGPVSSERVEPSSNHCLSGVYEYKQDDVVLLLDVEKEIIRNESGTFSYVLDNEFITIPSEYGISVLLCNDESTSLYYVHKYPDGEKVVAVFNRRILID